MNTTERMIPWEAIDPEIEDAVRDWTPRTGLGSRPEVAMEPRSDGLRVKLTYLGVETGVLFARGVPTAKSSVQGTLDRLFEVLSWRVVSPPIRTN